ncbi:DUF1566 domain-containing protein [Parabacteroides sp. GYB001]|uniref:Lcl C-terminal domain-containing protein n=1 Tax=Parabacteroides leei TaxID=2939491 RepID=UPI002017FA7B|nr:DUF1566 domain-containing protein [Parabacteroides leei]MCL3850844.1 DUF1566 domain-containing protein [Parabacteroides leei]
MYRINKVCIYFLLLLIFSAGSMSAQEVTTPNGYPVIDLSALNPLGAVLSSADAASRRTTMNQQTPSNIAYLAVGKPVSGFNGIWDAKMSIKYQVMQADLGSITDWASAWNQCKSYSGEGGDAGTWRLPTHRELQMICILHPLLIGKGNFTAFKANNYWDASEDTETYACLVRFTDGNVGSNIKTILYYVRCVRDL